MQRVHLLILSLFCSVSLIAQEIIVTGNVADADTGQSLPGATVFVEGTTNGTTTDFDGNFLFLLIQVKLYQSLMLVIKHRIN